MSKQTKALIYNTLSFLILFILFRFLVEKYTGFTGFKIPLASFVISTILAPKFQSVKTNEGGKIFMKFIFSKSVKEIK
jgi:hypothetical protein